jgi:hypothetical protein
MQHPVIQSILYDARELVFQAHIFQQARSPTERNKAEEAATPCLENIHRQWRKMKAFGLPPTFNVDRREWEYDFREIMEELVIICQDLWTCAVATALSLDRTPDEESAAAEVAAFSAFQKHELALVPKQERVGYLGQFIDVGSCHDDSETPTGPSQAQSDAALAPEATVRPVAVTPLQNSPVEILIDQLLSASGLANRLGVPKAPVDSFLRRYRKTHPDCCEEVNNPRKNEARILYHTAIVWPALLEQLPKWQRRRS